VKYILSLMLTVLSANTAHADNAKSDYVVILHGIARSSAHMKPLAEKLTKEGYDVINIDYPSTKYTLEELVESVNKDLSTRLTEDKPVHFIGYSMGGLLVRAILAKHRPAKLGRVIQLAPPNNGSEVADFLKNNWLYKTIYGPAGQQLTTNNNDTQKLLGKIDYDLGVIAGNSTIDPISSYIIGGNNDGKVSITSTKVAGMKDHVVVSASHTFFPGNNDVQRQTIYFLKNGKFNREKL
jgi:triacylglycerol esterase/lipase EstA (alpha/beta hydrolase family)